MTSRISLNIHAQNVPDKGRLFAFLQKLQPVAVTVLDEPGLAREIKDLLPDTIVIFRFNGDGGDGDLHRKISPRAWLIKMAAKLGGDRRIVLHTTNEPAFDKALIDWHCQLLDLPEAIGWGFACLGLATGNPAPEAWPIAKPLLERLAVRRDSFLNIHEYAGGVITSGLHGGYPDNAGVAPGKSGGTNLIQPSSWPRDVRNITRWHCGRFKFLLDFCDALQIAYPRIVLTEHGFDDTSDIKPWLDGLIRAFGAVSVWEGFTEWLSATRKRLVARWNALVINTPFEALYLNIRGWRTLQKQWSAWYGHLGWSPERAYFEQLKWANEVIYANSPVEAQCIFCWGHSSKDWEQFDIALAGELQQLLEAYAQQASPKPVPQPDPAPTPTPPPAKPDIRPQLVEINQHLLSADRELLAAKTKLQSLIQEDFQ